MAKTQSLFFGKFQNLLISSKLNALLAHVVCPFCQSPEKWGRPSPRHLQEMGRRLLYPLPRRNKLTPQYSAGSQDKTSVGGGAPTAELGGAMDDHPGTTGQPSAHTGQLVLGAGKKN